MNDSTKMDKKTRDLAPTMATPREQILHFAMNSKFGETYSFYREGDILAATKYIQCMRSELSRMRKIVKEAGRKRKPFKVKTVSLNHETEENQTLVTLIKENEAAVFFAEALDKGFSDLAI